MAYDWLGSGSVSARAFAERIIAETLRRTKGAIVFDPILAPIFQPHVALSVAVDPVSRIATVNWSGDSYVESVSMLVSLSAIPSDADTRPGGTADTLVLNGRSGSQAWPAFVVPQGGTIYAAAWGYSQPAGVGSSSAEKATATAVAPLPAIPQGTINVHENGIYDVLAQGPIGTGSWKYAINVGPSAVPPSEAAARAGTTVTPGVPREFALVNAGPATFGDKIVARLIPYTGASGTGEEFPSIVLTGAYQNTVTTKFDTFAGSVADLDPAVPFLVVNGDAGTLSAASGPFAPTPFAAVASLSPRFATGLTVDSLSAYCMLTYAGAYLDSSVIVVLTRVPLGTTATFGLAGVQTLSTSGAVQLLSTGSGLSLVLDLTTYLYYVAIRLTNSPTAGTGVCSLWSITIGYIQNNPTQGV